MTPRVRVVVLDHDGGRLTLECLDQLRKTDWPPDALDLVLVDNGSTRSVAAEVRRDRPDVRVIESATNLGFAGGCNLGLRDRAGVDYLALVNNDVTVEPGWLAPLVDALGSDADLGAACPKILFQYRFLDVTVASETHRRGRGDRRDLGVRVSGVRVDGQELWERAQPWRGFWGPEHGDEQETDYQWTDGDGRLRVPLPDPDRPPADCEVRLAADRTTLVTLRSGTAAREHLVGPEPGWYRAPLEGAPYDVINNVGSELVADGYGADRGYLEPDAGQYDRPADVFAWCGAAVVLPRRYLDAVGLLDERLFLYYEDFELALRGAERGWRYRYVPDAVVRHLHSATSVEGSPLAQHYNERNRLAVLTRHAAWGLLARAIVRYLLVTASYARRDLVSPLLHRAPTRPRVVRQRLRSFAAFLRLAPAMLTSRRRSSR